MVGLFGFTFRPTQLQGPYQGCDGDRIYEVDRNPAPTHTFTEARVLLYNPHHIASV